MIQGTLTTAYSPPLKLVGKYFIAGIASYFLLTLLLMLNYSSVIGFHFQPKILALTHIATLGWITMIIFGAMFQLVPVVLQVKIFSERMAEITFWIFVIGIVGFVYGFWNFITGPFLTLFAIVLNIALLLFSINIILSMRKISKWNFTAVHIAASIFYLIITAAAGLLLAINLGNPFIKINHLQYLNLHAHTALIGWVLMIIMGVVYKLIPMFSLSHGYSITPGKYSFILINIGLLGINAVMPFSKLSILFYSFSILIAVGIFLFIYQVYLIIHKRIRKKLDIGLKHTVVSFYILFAVTILGILITVTNISNIPNLTLVYGLLIIIGFISTLIIGQMYKIVPFLVWYHRFSGKVGKEKVPMLKDLYNEKLGLQGLYLMLVSISGITFSTIFDIKILIFIFYALLFLTAVIFSFNMLKIFLRKT